jgi:hypothetical protein
VRISLASVRVKPTTTALLYSARKLWNQRRAARSSETMSATLRPFGKWVTLGITPESPEVTHHPSAKHYTDHSNFLGSLLWGIMEVWYFATLRAGLIFRRGEQTALAGRSLAIRRRLNAFGLAHAHHTRGSCPV